MTFSMYRRIPGTLRPSQELLFRFLGSGRGSVAIHSPGQKTAAVDRKDLFPETTVFSNSNRSVKFHHELRQLNITLFHVEFPDRFTLLVAVPVAHLLCPWVRCPQSAAGHCEVSQGFARLGFASSKLIGAQTNGNANGKRFDWNHRSRISCTGQKIIKYDFSVTLKGI